MREVYELLIEKLVHGGLGIARTDRGVVFVSDVLPGERVRAEVIDNRAHCDFARPLEIIEPSPDRVQPFCPYAGRCGGCNWQHIVDKKQAAYKSEIFIDCMRRQGKIETLPEVDLHSSPGTRYRIRAQFRVDSAVGAVGFSRRDSNEVVDLESCPLLVDPLDRFMGRVRDEMRRAAGIPPRVKAIVGDGDAIASSPVIPGASCERVGITAGDRRFAVLGHSFFQNNTFLHKPLGRWAADKVGGRACVDLYGGAGFFSVMLAERFERIVLVEREHTLVSLANVNFAANGLPHCSAVRASAEAFAADRRQLDGVDCVIVDPPRQGLGRPVVSALVRAAPSTILSVSCDPATQARDVGAFVKHGSYAITQAAVFDLYPNTHHLESVVVLKKREAAER